MELLAPAGSFDALKAAVSAGADAVYFGGAALNARMYSKNFSDEELKDAAAYCKGLGVKTYLTLNTLVSDKEFGQLMPFLRLANESAVDGVIVQDLGLARVIKAAVPYLPIHASTQMTICSLDGVKQAADLGFSRAVVSRELPKAELKYICEHSPIEIEAFIHGALCMCYSGQCYLSSAIGGRSGNRGKCAQPCRKKYENGYELSLKDLCMARDFRSFAECGVASLKIEGRMKSPAYVAGVVEIYRRLIDENRNATEKEIQRLEALFSREGFTNAYFLNNPSEKMFGVRTEADKEKSRLISENEEILTKKIPLDMEFTAKTGENMRLAFRAAGEEQTEEAEPAPLAKNAESTPEMCEKQLKKLGDTYFSARNISCETDGGLFIPNGVLNRLRRACADGLWARLRRSSRPFYDELEHAESKDQNPHTVASCLTVSQAKAAENYADEIWLPLFAISENIGRKTAAVLPPVLFDRDISAVESRLKAAKEMGITKAVCKNIGQIALCKRLGFTAVADSNLNVFNSHALAEISEMGVREAVLSFELNAAQLRGVQKCMPVLAVVYGRYPVMVTENCILRNKNACIHEKGFGALTDETGRTFPVFCAFPHRNVIYNAVPLYMADKAADLPNCGHLFLFTTETAAEVADIFEKYKKHAPSDGAFTRGFYNKKV